MKTNHDSLLVYEEMVALSGQMLAAAGDGDWDRLVTLESACAARVRLLQAEAPDAPLSGPKREQKVKIIQQLLEHDRQIRDLTMPWMAQLSALINSTGAERRLASAYGA